MRYTFTLTLRVDSPAALQRAAFASYVADNNHADLAYADATALFGEEGEPNIGTCLVQLLDPGSLPGCGIDGSSAEGDS